MQEQMGRADSELQARAPMTAPKSQDARATGALTAFTPPTAHPPSIDEARYAYRLAKTAEDNRNRFQAGTVAFVRTYISGWQPGADAAERERRAASAKRIVKHVLREARPKDARGRPLYPLPGVLEKEPLEPGDQDLLAMTGTMIHDMAVPWWQAEGNRQLYRAPAEAVARQWPAWPRLSHIKGFSEWGLVAIVGEAGDIGAYSGCRKLFKRLGLAPDECYPVGERRRGRKIPRRTRGRIMGMIAEPLLRAQWRGAGKGMDGGGNGCLGTNESQGATDPVPSAIPAHAIGPFGAVYGAAKARHLAAGRSPVHADKAARRAMAKALLHDVHLAWHGRPLDYAKEGTEGEAEE